jgi:hypothetical protein
MGSGGRGNVRGGGPGLFGEPLRQPSESGRSHSRSAKETTTRRSKREGGTTMGGGGGTVHAQGKSRNVHRSPSLFKIPNFRSGLRFPTSALAEPSGRNPGSFDRIHRMDRMSG